jgi:hypothetical protein
MVQALGLEETAISHHDPPSTIHDSRSSSLHRPGDGDGLAAGLVSGAEADVEAVGDGGSGEGEVGGAALL